MNIFSDLKYAFRLLVKNPSLTVLAAGVLALGIGANTAILSVVNGVLLRALPFPEPDCLVTIRLVNPEEGMQENPLSLPDLRDWQEQAETLESLGAYPAFPFQGLTLARADLPIELKTSYVSGGLFETLGVQAVQGRGLSRQNDREGTPRVVVLSHAFWRDTLGKDSAIVGRDLTLDGEPWTVIGIMPESFRFPQPEVDVWAPLNSIDPSRIPHHLRVVRWLEVVGRLRDGVTLEQAREELSNIARRQSELYPDSNQGWTGVQISPLREELVGHLRRPLGVLFVAVILVLLIACANVANLLLARATTRQREMAVRTAMGASRGRLVWQLLTESVLLSLLAAGFGLILALWAVDFLTSLDPVGVTRSFDIGIDRRILLFTVGISLLTALVFGLFPALRSTRFQLTEGLRQGRSGGPAIRSLGMLRFLVVAEVALAAALVVGAGLMIRTVTTLQQVDPGFDSKGVLAVQLTVPTWKYPSRPEYLEAHRRLTSAFESIPGVQSVGVIKNLPFVEPPEWTAVIPPAPSEGQSSELVSVTLYPISGRFFEALAIPLLRGRPIDASDRADTQPVAVANRALTRLFWTDGDPVGRSLQGEGLRLTIVGESADIRHASLSQDPLPALYLPVDQFPRRRFVYLLRSSLAPEALIRSARGAVRRADPDQPITRIEPLQSLISSSTASSNHLALLLGVFAFAGLVLTALGVYGVISYVVTQRRHEMGVRLALGASREDLLQMVIREGVWLTVLGLAAGLLVSLGLTRLLSGLLFGVQPNDPLTYAAVGALLFAIAVLSCYLPARRAASVDPTTTLRYE